LTDLAALLDRCRAGDPLAWEALVRRFQGRVYGIAIVHLGNAEEARDLAQDVFVRLYRRLDLCTNDETFIPWLVQITRNAAIDRIRRRRSRPRAIDIPVEELSDLPSPAPGPAEEYRAARRRALVHKALGKLGRLNREIILLKEIQGLSLEAIATMLKAPVGTIKSRSNRARIELARVLSTMMREEGGDPRFEP